MVASKFPHGILPDMLPCGLRMRRDCRERFFPAPRVSVPDIHHGTWSLTTGFLWSRWRGKCSRHSGPMHFIFISDLWHMICFQNVFKKDLMLHLSINNYLRWRSVTPHGDIDLGQYWPRLWLAVWCQRVFNKKNSSEKKLINVFDSILLKSLLHFRGTMGQPGT